MKMNMRRRLTPFALTACLALSGCHGSGTQAAGPEAPSIPGAAAPKPVKILAWNLEHFTDPFDDPYIDADQENRGSSKEAAQLEDLADALRIIDPDIFILQEVEGDRAIKLFVERYLPDSGYTYFACTPSFEWYQNVVFASRIPMGEMVSFREADVTNAVTGVTKNSYNNRLTAVRFMPTPEYSFVLYGAHLKAGRDPEDYSWREEQVRLVKRYMVQQLAADPATNILVMGDMNFRRDEAEFTVMTTGAPPTLIDAFGGLDGVYSHPASGPSRLIDHIFYNENLRAEVVPDSAAVSLPLSTTRLSQIADHLPVVISIMPVER